VTEKSSKVDSTPQKQASLTQLNDEELVEQCREELPDKMDAYTELLNRYEGLVFHTCCRMLGNVQEAEETCQDVFLRLYQKIGQFEGRSQFKTWLFRVVHNLCLTRRRTLAIRRERREEIEAEAARGEFERQQDAGGATENQGDLSETVRQAIAKLKPEDQEVLMLRFLSEMGIEEIAAMLGMGLSATKMRLYRAMERFKALYSENHLSEEDQPDSSPGQSQPDTSI
jgi:RNA polymerase sigma-70 factor (ECF subfamily)